MADVDEEHDANDSSSSVVISELNHIKKWTSQQKYSRAMDTCRKIANTIAMCSQADFDHRVEQLIALNDAWSRGNEVGIQVFGSDANLRGETDTSDAVQDYSSGEAGTSATTSDTIQDAECPTTNVETIDGILDLEAATVDTEIDSFHSSIDPLDDILRRIDAVHHPATRPNSIDQDFARAISSSISGVIDANYDDDLFAFNLNCVSHPIDSDVNISLTSIIDQIVENEKADRPSCSSTVTSSDGKVTLTKLKNIKMPPPVKVKGRPKGSDQTNVIGTKKASKKKVSCQKFVEMRNADKDKLMLTLCIGKEATEIVLRRGGVVNLEDIDPTEISNAVFNPIICLESIRYLFSDEAWDRGGGSSEGIFE